MDLASWLLFTCCLYIMLLISMAFDAFIRVLFYRHCLTLDLVDYYKYQLK